MILSAQLNSRTVHEELISAAQQGNNTLLEERLLNGSNVNTVNNDGWSLLMLAAWSGHADTVRLLLEHGASVNTTDRAGNDVFSYSHDSEVISVLNTYPEQLEEKKRIEQAEALSKANKAAEEKESKSAANILRLLRSRHDRRLKPI